MRTQNIYAEMQLVLECDKELSTSEQVGIFYHILSAEQEAYVRDVSIRVGPAQATLDTISMGLTRVSNLKDEEGNEIPMTRDTKQHKLPGGIHPLTDKFISYFPSAEREEIGTTILQAGSRARESEVKKS